MRLEYDYNGNDSYEHKNDKFHDPRNIKVLKYKYEDYSKVVENGYLKDKFNDYDKEEIEKQWPEYIK